MAIKPVKTVKAPNPSDLFDYLWQGIFPEGTEVCPPPHEIDVAFNQLRKVLRENKPVGLAYVDNGLALVFQNGDKVPFLPEEPVPIVAAPAVSVTQGGTRRRGEHSLEAKSWPVR